MKQLSVTLLLLLVATGATAAPPAHPAIHYRVEIPQPSTHVFRITVTVAPVRARTVELAFTAWAPGAYRITDHAKNVLAAAARDGAGTPLPATKIDKQTWRITRPAGADESVAFTYDLFANVESRPFHAQVNYERAFYTAVRIFPYLKGAKDAPVSLELIPPTGWEVANTLPRTEGRAGYHYTAPDFDTFADAIAVMGPIDVIPFEYLGTPYYIVFSGQGNYDREQVKEDVAAIVRTQIDLFDETPFTDYTFIYLLYPRGGGGLEHLNGTSIAHSRNGFTDPGQYRRFLSVTAHEFYHLWNVKRIRPVGLGPFDYEREVHTKLLYVSEGFTSYYALMTLRWADLDSPRRFYKYLARMINRYQTNEGRTYKSLERYSWDSWLDSDFPHFSNRTYYNKGALVGMILDLEIRHRTEGARSLDDVMRLLNTRFAHAGKGFTDADFRTAVEEVGGGDFSDLFRDYVEGTAELDFNRFLAYAGLEVREKEKKKDQDEEAGEEDESEEDPAKPFLGFRRAEDRGFVRVRTMLPGGPGEAAGLEADDLLIAMDGAQVRHDQLQDRLKEKGVGTTVTFTLLRDEQLLEIPVTIADAPHREKAVVEREEATEAQRAFRRGWLRLPAEETPAEPGADAEKTQEP